MRALRGETDVHRLCPNLVNRAWVIGMLLTTIGSGLNALFTLRSPAISITSIVAQLVAYPLGVGWSWAMPNRQFNTFGVKWNLNPGPFNFKEHTIIVIMANASFGGGAGYFTDTIERLNIVGFDWPCEDLFRRFDLRRPAVFLDRWGAFAVYRILRRPHVSQIAHSIRQHAHHLRRPRGPTSSYSSQLSIVGCRRYVFQQISPKQVPRLVDAVQLYHVSRPRLRPCYLHDYYHRCSLTHEHECAELVGERRGVEHTRRQRRGYQNHGRDVWAKDMVDHSPRLLLVAHCQRRMYFMISMSFLLHLGTTLLLIIALLLLMYSVLLADY